MINISICVIPQRILKIGIFINIILKQISVFPKTLLKNTSLLPSLHCFSQVDGFVCLVLCLLCTELAYPRLWSLRRLFILYIVDLLLCFLQGIKCNFSIEIAVTIRFLSSSPCIQEYTEIWLWGYFLSALFLIFPSPSLLHAEPCCVLYFKNPLYFILFI